MKNTDILAGGYFQKWSRVTKNFCRYSIQYSLFWFTTCRNEKNKINGWLKLYKWFSAVRHIRGTWPKKYINKNNGLPNAKTDIPWNSNRYQILYNSLRYNNFGSGKCCLCLFIVDFFVMGGTSSFVTWHHVIVRPVNMVSAYRQNCHVLFFEYSRSNTKIPPKPRDGAVSVGGATCNKCCHPYRSRITGIQANSKF